MAKSKKSQALEAVKNVEILSKPKKRKKSRGVLLLGLGAIIALAASADLRSKLLDALFGAEEEFEYTSTTSPSSAAPTAA